MKLNNKRIFTLIIALIFICINFIGCQSDNKNKESDNKNKQTTKPALKIDYTLYKPYIEKALEAHKQVNNYTSAQGLLFDIDENGVDELLIIHEADLSCVYDVYTIKDNKVYELIEDEKFFLLAGGPSGDVYILNGKNGEKYIGFKYTEVDPGYGTENYFNGTWAVYDINGIDVTEIRKVKYTYVSDKDVIDYSLSKAIIAGEEVSYKEFEKWLSEYSSKLIVSAYGYDIDNRLEDLLDKLS